MIENSAQTDSHKNLPRAGEAKYSQGLRHAQEIGGAAVVVAGELVPVFG